MLNDADNADRHHAHFVKTTIHFLQCKVGRGNSGRGVNSGRPLLFSGEEGLDFQTWYAG